MRCWFVVACLLLLPLPSLAGPQDSWTVDAKASTLGFSVAQVGSLVSGRFPAWTGDIVLDPSALASARIDIKIDTRPVSTNNRDVDSLMKGPNFLDVQKFPEARFVSTAISGSGDRYEARGKLTIRDVTRDAVLPFTLAITDDPAQPGRVRATARGRLILKRLDYGVGQNEWAATGQVANEVTVDLNVVAGRAK
ncbi:MAG: YceI family protein [Rhodospirillales bacterium]|nr:YceI family protein [Rhodospirillales bacterium]